MPPEDPAWRRDEPAEPAELQPGEVMRIQRFNAARESLRAIDPTHRELDILAPPGYVPIESDIARVEGAARDAAIQRTCDFLRPDGKFIGQPGTSSKVRVMSGGLAAAQRDYNNLSVGGTALPMLGGSRVGLPGAAGFITFRPVTSTPGSPAIDVNIPGVIQRKLHY